MDMWNKPHVYVSHFPCQVYFYQPKNLWKTLFPDRENITSQKLMLMQIPHLCRSKVKSRETAKLAQTIQK